MNRKKHRLLPAIAPMLLALSFLTSGCVEPLDPSLRGSTDPNAVSLPIRLYIPNAMPATKAGAGDVSGVSPESQIYSIQVWMYDHATGTEATDNEQKPVSYAQAYLGWNQQNNLGKWDKSGYYASGQWTSDQIYELLFKIPNSVIESTRPMKFDFYVLANGTSIGSSGSPATPTMTRGELKALKFGNNGTNDYFGSTNPVTGATEPVALGQDGLPISGFFNKGKDDSGTAATGVDLSFLRDKTKPASGDDPERPYTNDEIKAMSPVIQLERAVSKIRFAFARPQGLVGVQICKIEIDAGLIPQQTYVFPRETGNFLGVGTNDYSEDDYIAATKVMVPKNWTEAGSPLLATSAIKEVPDPTLLRSDCPTPTPADGGKDYSGKKPSEMTAQDYSHFLDDNTTSQILYLRESGKPITGKIYYKLSADQATPSVATFDMSTIPDYEVTNTNFYRNHSWIVYAYFQGGGLHIKPVVVADWVYDYNSQTQTALQYYEYLQKGSARVAFSDDSRSLFGYGYTTSTGNDWRRYHPTAKTEWYFRRQSWNSADHEFDPSQPAGVSCYDWDDWVNSQMIVAPGKNAANVPMYANRIELRTNGFNYSYTSGGNEVTVPIPLTLKVDNPQKFDIVLYHSGSNSYEVFTDGKATFTSAVDKTTTTYFYIVPKDSASEGDHTAAYLLTDPDVSTDETLKNSGLPQEKLPFNTSVFPGSEDNTEIFFYCVALSTFQGFYTPANDPNPLPQNVKVYGSNVITDLP